MNDPMTYEMKLASKVLLCCLTLAVALLIFSTLAPL